VSFERKMSWTLQLEHQRLLRVEPPPPAPPPPVVAPARGKARPTPVVVAPPPPTPDLLALLRDEDARVRRRAALAVGRVGLVEGVAPLVALLSDADADVRAMAAFGIGLIGIAATATQPVAEQAAGPLTAALTDAHPRVRGRAAEALGQIDAKSAADSIGRVAAEYARSPVVAALTSDDEPRPAPPEADALRLALGALVRLRAYEPLAAAVSDSGAKPIAAWWPVAYALQRVGDRRAQPLLAQLLATPGKYTAAFAARGLGDVKDASSVIPLLSLLSPGKAPIEVVVSAIRALAQIGDRQATGSLIALVAQPKTDPNVRLEAVTALGALGSPEALPIVQDLLTDPWPTMRSAALRAAAAIDRETFLLVLASLDPDRDWTVRAALAHVLPSLGSEAVVERLRAMLADQDKRVIPAALNALVQVKAPDVAGLALTHLKDPDYTVRSAAAGVIGRLKPEGGIEALQDALTLAKGDAAYDARVAILSALAEYGTSTLDVVKTGLADQDWAVRLRTLELLAKLEPSADFRNAIRPAPGAPDGAYDDPSLIAPVYSPHVFIETDKGTVEFELAVLDAPQTTRSFMALIRKGFFNGLVIHRVVPNFVVQDGDPRGDGEGGPGYTLRDELNERPFLRGTVGIALAGRDTGGSQFFIMHSPAPHLDARYTVFGQVVNGMDVVDRLQQGDVIQRMRVWDGKTMQ
jgi:cyclophilin family peptidyl-prolyl cis-trans isomerase/HEAT repeat protein